MATEEKTPTSKSNELDSAKRSSSPKSSVVATGSDKPASGSDKSITGSGSDQQRVGSVAEENEAKYSHAKKFILVGFCDWNFFYCLRLRGIMNISHLICSLATLSLLSTSCQFRPTESSSSEGFFCKPPETFLFVVSCSAFITSFLYLASCMFSRQTSILLFQTSFEAAYFIFYFVLLLTASVSLMISIINWGADRVMYGNSYNKAQLSSIIGLIGGVLYGISAMWFFISHLYYTKSSAYSHA